MAQDPYAMTHGYRQNNSKLTCNPFRKILQRRGQVVLDTDSVASSKPGITTPPLMYKLHVGIHTTQRPADECCIQVEQQTSVKAIIVLAYSRALSSLRVSSFNMSSSITAQNEESPDGSVASTKPVSRFTRWFRSPLFNVILIGLISFTQPGIWNALNSMSAPCEMVRNEAQHDRHRCRRPARALSRQWVQLPDLWVGPLEL